MPVSFGIRMDMDRRKQLEQELSHLAVCAPHLYAMTLVRGLQRDADDKARRVILDRLVAFAQSDGGATEELRLFRRRALGYAAAGDGDYQQALGALGDLVPTLGQAALRHSEAAHLRPMAERKTEELRNPTTLPTASEEIVLHGERIAMDDLPRLRQGAAPAEREALVDRLGDLDPKRLLLLRMAADLRITSLSVTGPRDAAEAREVEDLKRGVALASRAIHARGIEAPAEIHAATVRSGGIER